MNCIQELELSKKEVFVLTLEPDAPERLCCQRGWSRLLRAAGILLRAALLLGGGSGLIPAILVFCQCAIMRINLNFYFSLTSECFLPSWRFNCSYSSVLWVLLNTTFSLVSTTCIKVVTSNQKFALFTLPRPNYHIHVSL